ncbi:MAG: amidophosphoribosyltransferase [bacterium]|nr:amidophosphoribosyltransferase [bacterium]
MCGVFGVATVSKCDTPFLPAAYTYTGLYMLQHRGQEAAGEAAWDNGTIRTEKRCGLVTTGLTKDIIQSLPGTVAIGHVRYSTTGESVLLNAHPHYRTDRRKVAVVHNGNLPKSAELRKELEAEGVEFESTSDTEIIAAMISRSTAPTIEEAVIETCMSIEGSYALLVLAEGKLIGVRDPFGIRPLYLGRSRNERGEEFYLLTSETCAFGFLRAETTREIAPGEMLVIDGRNRFHYQLPVEAKRKLCIFEFIYFSRPDSVMMGQWVCEVRHRLGQNLARQCKPVNLDKVIPVPESGNHAAVGFAEASGVPFGYGFAKNRYLGRTFIAPDGWDDLVRHKYAALEPMVAGKRLAEVEDSIVRANTTGGTVAMLKDAGALRVEVEVVAPPVKYPCFYGIAMSTRGELIAADKTIEEVRDYIGADQLNYLSQESTIEATRCPKDQFCMACFDGDYPIPVPSE